MKTLNSGDVYYNVNDFPYETCLVGVKTVRGKRKQSYYNCSAAYDIETTSLENNGNPIGFMYAWQLCVNGYVVFGRYWDEFNYFLHTLREMYDLGSGKVLVIYVHNLAFEFQFTKDFIEIDSIFAREKRKPIKVVSDGIEFRCSYYLSNMSLAKFCENSELCTHYKLDGNDYDYRKLRTPKTELSDLENQYRYNDVKGLCECIDTKLQEDTIASIPLTSTGYVRRDFRHAMNTKRNQRIFKKTALTAEQYKMLRKAFRGGNTHASRFYANKVLSSVYSFDKQSSYIGSMMYDKVPVGKFTECTIDSQEKLELYMKKYCMVLDVSFYNLETQEPVPYIDIAHTQERSNILNDNGRILKADYIRITLTNVDLEIIRKTYKYEGFQIHKAIYATPGLLPKEFREQLMVYFHFKTTLKGIDGKEYEYMKSKNKLNASYGMCVTAIDNDVITYLDGIWSEEKPDLEKCLEDYYKSYNSFLSYQWGVFIIANSRKRLQDGIDIVGNDLVYVDTDSVKFINSKHVKEFELLNKQIILECESCDIPAYEDYNGKRYYLGIWENETEHYINGCYSYFKTLGAKKYAHHHEEYDKDGKVIDKFETTVSGMSKKKGAKAVGDIFNFNIGTTYNDIGRTTSWYNEDGIHDITINNETFKTASNIAVLESTYTLGVTNEYWELICNNT